MREKFNWGGQGEGKLKKADVTKKLVNHEDVVKMADAGFEMHKKWCRGAAMQSGQWRAQMK